jgi:hypothetical protein
MLILIFPQQFYMPIVLPWLHLCLREASPIATARIS